MAEERETNEPSPRSVAEFRPRLMSRAVGLVGILLLLQALELIAIGLYPNLVEDLFSHLPIELQDSLHPDSADATFSRVFVPLGLMASIAAVGVFLRQPVAWMMAMTVEGLCLAAALFFYFTAKPVYVYPVMIVGIVMVLYLNYAEVVNAFRPRRSQSEGEGTR